MDVGRLVRKWDWVGLVVTPVRPIANGFGRVEPGVELLVTWSHGGLQLVSRPCSYCAVQWNSAQWSVYKVQHRDVRVVRRAVEAPPVRTGLDITLATMMAWPSPHVLVEMIARDAKADGYTVERLFSDGLVNWEGRLANGVSLKVSLASDPEQAVVFVNARARDEHHEGLSIKDANGDIQAIASVSDAREFYPR